MKRDKIVINDTNFAHNIGEQLTNMVNFVDKYQDSNMLFIVSSNNTESKAITGAIGSQFDIKKMLVGMSCTTLYTACDNSYFNVVKLLQEVSHHVMDHFTEEDKQRLVRELDEELSKIVKDVDGE